MIQKESTFKRGGGGDQDVQPAKTWKQRVGNITTRMFKRAKKVQIVYMLGIIMVEGVFYLRRGLVSSEGGSNVDIGCGVYLIALASSWIFLLIFVPRIQTRFIPLAPSLFIATSSVSMKLQIDPHENNEQNSQFQSRDHILNQENPSQYNAGGSSSLQCPPGVAGMDSLAKSRKQQNNSNNQAASRIEQQLSTQDTPQYMQILQDIGVVVSASSAIVIMHEQYLRRLTSSGDTTMNLQHLQSVLAIFILLQKAATKLSNRKVSQLFLVIALGYLLLRSSIHAGFQAESVCLSFIIFLQVVTSPFSVQSKKNRTKNPSGLGSTEPNKKNSNNFHQQLQFSPKNAQQQGQQQFQQQQQQFQQKQQQQEQSPNDFPILNKQIHYYRKNHTAQIIMQHQSPSSYSKIGEPYFSKQLIPLAKRGNHLLASHSRQTQQQSIQELYFEPTNNNNKHNEFNNNSMGQSQNLRHKDSEGSTNSLLRLVTVDQKINKLNLGGFYAQLIGLIPVGIAIISNSNQLLYASSQLLQMLDCKDEQKALKILLTLSTNSKKAPYFAKEQSQPQENNQGNGQPQEIQDPNLQGDSPPEPEDCRKDTVKEDDGIEQIGKNAQDTQGVDQQQQQQDISYLSSHYFQSKHHSSGGVLQQEGNPIKRANSGMLNGSMKSKPGSDLLADQSPITLSSQNATNKVPNNNNSSGNNNVKEIISKHESIHGQNKHSNTTTQLLQSQQMHQISAVSFTKFNGSMLTPQNIGIEEDRSSRYFLQNAEDLEDEGQRSRRMSASISAQTLHPPIQPNYQQYSKSLLGKDDNPSEYCIDRNQYQGTSSAQISPRILSTAPISGGICSTKRSKPKSGQIYNEETEDTLGQFSAYGRKQSLTGVAQKERESAKSIIEEEENAVSGSIVEPSGMISEMQFQPLEQYKNYSSPVTIGRHTQRNISMLRSVRNSSNTNNNNNNNNNFFNTNDTFSENKSEIIQKDESVLNILNTMFGGGIGIDQTPRPSFTRMKSSKKVTVQHASFLPQLSHFSIDADINNFGSPRLQQQFMKTPETTGHQQETNSTNKLQREESNPSKQGVSQEPSKEDKPQDFEDILKQNTKYGYFQQEGNVSIMQIEYLGCQYVLKIIINEVRVGDNGSLQKVAIMVMEKMWQDFLVKRVEDMIQQKMQLFGSLSHELRTPLNCSISMMEVLHNITSSLDTQTKNMMDKYIQPALNSNKLLLNMINDILDFVQLENGSFKFGLIEFDLYALLKECVSLVSIQASMKKLTVACYYDPQTPRIIKSDPNRIRQVILNFLSNSLKFTLQGHIILFASAYKSISEVTIGVKDTGIGINQDNIHEIFKAFNKVDLGEKSKLNMQGCGVGLALSNSIAKALGPDSGSERGITVESTKNEGSTFSFLVKNLKAAEQQNDKEEDIYENSELSYEHLIANSTNIRHRVTQVFPPTSKEYQMQDSIPTQCSRKHHPHRQPSSSSPKCAAGMIRKKGTAQTLNQTLTRVTGDLGNSSIEDSRQNINNNNNLAGSNYNINNNNLNNSTGWNEMKARSVSITHASASQKKSFMFPIHTQDLNLNLDGFQLPNVGTPSLLQYPLSTKNNNNNTNSNPTNNNNNILNNIRTASILESIKSKEFTDMKLLDHSKVEYPDGFNSYMQENSPDCVKRSLESIQNDILSYACSCTQILVVDDQEFNLFSLTELLKQFYNIFSDTALNHEQVLKRISDRLLSNCCKTYKIIFMDINMPNKNGYQVAKMIKQFYSNPKNSQLALPATIIIACSAYNGEEDKLRATAAGMTDFVTKPIMKKDLDTIISKYYEVQMQVPLSVLPPI